MEENKKVFYELETLATNLKATIEKLIVTSNDISNNCEELKSIEEIKELRTLYFLSIKPIGTKNDIINDYLLTLNNYCEDLDKIVYANLSKEEILANE